MKSCTHGHQNPDDSRFCGQCGEPLDGTAELQSNLPTAAPVAEKPPPPVPSWSPDPTGRHEHRFWDGTAWTDHVADGGRTGVDSYAPEVAPISTAEAFAASDDAMARVPALAESQHTLHSTHLHGRVRRRWVWVAAGVLIVAAGGAIAAALASSDGAKYRSFSDCYAHFHGKHPLSECSRLFPSGAPAKQTPESTTTTTTLPAAVVLQEIQNQIGSNCDLAAAGTVTPEGAANALMGLYGDRWGSTTNASALAQSITQCVQAKADAAIAGAQPVSVDAIVKNPDAVKGQYFVMVTDITQYDAATGACAFRGYWDAQDHEYNYEYAGDNAFFESGDGLSKCPVLTGIDQNDVVRVWAQSEGSYSYDTQIGGSTTVPKFKIVKAEIIRKA